MHHHLRTIVLSGFLIMIGLTGCDDAGGKKAPPKAQVVAALQETLPAYLKVDSVELDVSPKSDELALINFKAKLSSREELYTVDRIVPGSPEIELLKKSQSSGDGIAVYGKLLGKRMMDKWELSPPAERLKFSEFGKPRSSFIKESYLSGSSDAEAALKHQAENEKLSIKRDAELAKLSEEKRVAELSATAAARAEGDRIESLNAVQAAEKARLAEEVRIAPFTAGKTYSGTVTYKSYMNDQMQRLTMVITSRNGFEVEATFLNPDEPERDKVKYFGVISSKADKYGNSTVALNIIRPQVRVNGRWDFYETDGSSMTLQTSAENANLTGDARAGGNGYTVRLQPKK